MFGLGEEFSDAYDDESCMSQLSFQVLILMLAKHFCICKNTGADQLHGNRTAGQCLCLRNIDSTTPVLPKSKISSQTLAIFCGCTA